MIAINILLCVLYLSAFNSVSAWNLKEKLMQLSNASICHGINTLKTLMSIPNQAHDAFNVLASTACLLNGYSANDSVKLFRAFKFNAGFNKVDDVFSTLNELNVQQLYTSTSLYIIEERFTIKDPFRLFMRAFQYATLKPNATFVSELEDDGDVKQFLTNNSIDPFLAKKFMDHIKLFENDTMVYINGAKFSKKFKVPFDVKNTKTLPFKNFGTKETMTKYMRGTMYSRYANNTEYSALELPFEKEDRFLVICPHKPDGYKEMLSKICHDDIWKIINSLGKPKNVAVTLPKFSVTSEKSIESFRADADISHLLSSDAKLTGIAEGLHFSQMYMLTNIELNETGISYEALTASKTDKQGKGRTMDVVDVSFECTHPFIYFILSKKECVATLVGYVDEL
ncbi:leukocyte elastase inhibitor-like protein [Leptotrombidium deliense]|uniref:Leukocyte elastase inhibitor-like protein n=1 Tax=Leptotrombidium deliense TaxID=299467 RepID=A0A443S950_9ACAR|nr:leukocyte elastase inhibitor-like protein [Leptotrombidium deliense]